MIQRIRNELQKFRRDLEAKGYSVKRMILFGSHARGDAMKYSDVDIIIVSPQFIRLSPPRRRMMLEELWAPMDLPIETLPYTPDEFRQIQKTSYTVKEAMRYGQDVEQTRDFFGIDKPLARTNRKDIRDHS